jgi:hypothetical protein
MRWMLLALTYLATRQDGGVLWKISSEDAISFAGNKAVLQR